jgi:WD40 repeat protein
VNRWDSVQLHIKELSFSPDNQLLTVADDGSARLWKVDTGLPIADFQHEGLLAATFARGQPRIVTQDGTGIIRLYDVRTSALLSQTSRKAAGGDARVAVDEASALLAAADRSGAVTVIDLRTGKRVRDLPPDDRVPASLAIAPGGDAIAIASGSQVRLWSLISTPAPKEIALEASHVGVLAFSPDGSWLATAGDIELGDPRGLLALWSVADGHRIASFETEATLAAVSWSPDGRHLVVGSGFVKTFDLSPETRNPSEVARILDRLAPRTARQAASPPISDPFSRFKYEHDLTMTPIRDVR